MLQHTFHHAMTLTHVQKEQVLLQLQRHQRKSLHADIPLSGKATLRLLVEKGVFGSDIMSSGIYLARFLHAHKKMFKGKVCLDMGCGPGTQGILMALYGAASVDLSDINPKAVRNTNKNIIEKELTRNCAAYVSDLFKALPEKKYEVIVFNHPFFPEEAANFGAAVTADVQLRKSMLGGTGLLQRFLSDVKRHLHGQGIIIMPYFHFAGPQNDPQKYLKKYGLRLQSEDIISSKQGLQRGDFSIYVITTMGD
jgi:methylase of polypeptide subunit release factors